MKRYLLFIAVLLFTACTSEPQPSIVSIDKNNSHSKDMKSLKISLEKYTKATISNDIDTLIGFIYPKAFTIVPKEKMLKMFKKTRSSGNIPIVKDIRHTEITPIKKYDAGVYSIITSSMITVIKSPRPNDKKFEDYMLTTLQNQIGSRGMVTLNKNKHLFNIQHTNKTMALNEKGSWKFIGFKQAKKYINNRIFPLMLIEKLK